MAAPAPTTDLQCPLSFALDMFGDRWSLLILRDIFFKQKRSYSEFLTSPEKISTNILASRLQKLETQGLLQKRRDPDKQTRFIYRPTRKAVDLLPVMLEMIAWSARYDPQDGISDSIIDGAPPRLLERLASDREALIADIVAAAAAAHGDDAW